MGLIHLASLEKATAQAVMKERERHGPYLHLQDFIERTAIDPEQLNILVSIGAFRFTGKTKKQLLWEANFLQRRVMAPISAQPLFKEKPLTFRLPDLRDHPVDDMYDEMEILGFPLRNPFELMQEPSFSRLYAKELPHYLGKQVDMLLYFIDHKVVPTAGNTIMSFGAFLDEEMNWVDTVHFPMALQRYPLKGKGFYHVRGKVVEDFGFHSVEVLFLEKIGYKERTYANLK